MRPLVRVAVATAGVLSFTGGAANAAIPDASGVYQGCYHRNSGGLRVVDVAAGDSCSNGEVGVTWSQTGPQGPKGDTGAKGDQGDKGSKGDTGLMGYSVVNDPNPNLAGCPGLSGHGFEIVDSFGAVIAGSQVVVCDGATGARGAKGDTGAPGAKGDTGDTGAKGDTGAPGAKGDTGAQGPAGPAQCPCWNEGQLRLFVEARFSGAVNCQRGANASDGTKFAFILNSSFSTGVSAAEGSSSGGTCALEVSFVNTTVFATTIEQTAACRSEIINIGKTIPNCF